MATRTIGDARFNHGAQYFTARSDAFRDEVNAWVEAGLVRKWTGRVVRIARQQIESCDDGRELYVGVGGMSAVPKHLVKGLDYHSGKTIARAERGNSLWSLFDDRGRLFGQAESLVLAMPAPQAIALLGEADDVARRLEDVEMDPTWALMITRATPQQIPFDAAHIEHDAVAWMMRSVEGENSWVVHATHAWSRKNLTRDPRSAAYALLAYVSDATGLDFARSGAVQAHRWRFAIPTEARPFEPPVVVDSERRLALCGDWCVRGRVESAYQSGVAAADAIARVTLSD